MLENLVQAPRAVRVQHSVPARGAARAALELIRPPLTPAALARAAPARDAVRNKMWRNNELCCARVHKQDERTRIRERRQSIFVKEARNSRVYYFLTQ